MCKPCAPCMLRPWRMEDAKDLAAVLNNQKILDCLRDGLPYPYTQQDAEWFISSMLAAEPGTVYARAITVEGRAVGSISAYRQENVHFRTAELGYYLGEPYWGRGIATSAVIELCSFIFRETDILRIFAEPFSHNQASCRVLEKAGFLREGVMRKNAVKNGIVRDMALYARVKEQEGDG